MDTLNERSRLILEAIIEDYINTAEPVGSRTLTRRHGISLSPASVRNVMSDLEEAGFLASPHTSAGRVPTEKAYRFYVDSLLQVRGFNQGEEEEIRRQYSSTGKDLAGILRETSRTLSMLSHYTGIVLAPRFASTLFRHLEFVRLSERRLLAILVTQNGNVQNKIIETDLEWQVEDLVRITNYLNGLLQGLTIDQVKRRILQEMQSEKVQYDALLSRALRLSQESLVSDSTEVFIEGQANILDQPECNDVTRMRDLFRAFEEKRQLIDLLDRSLEADGVHIYIGAESHVRQMEGMSLIAATYSNGTANLGVLGVIGPTRMGYAKVIPIVDYTARLVSRLLE